MTLQFRRGTDSDRLTITPSVGEPIYTTDTKQLYVGDGSTAGGTLVSGAVDSASTQAIIDSNIGAIGADLLPAVDSTYDLGSATKKWKDLHLSGNSIFLGGHKIVKDGDTIKFTDSTGATINVTAGNVASSLIDSSDVTAIITAGGYTTYDSTNASGQITTAINNLVDAAPASLDTLNELAAALNDDANFAATVTGQIAALPDSAQVATIVTSYGYTTYDSGNTTGLIDSAYINARTDANLDSALTIALIDSAYVQARQTAQDFAYSSLTGTPNVLDSTDVALIAQANDTTRDSAFVTGIVDSAYIQARQVDLQRDSAFITNIVDSAYINARVSATDSATVSAIITADVDAAFINALTIGADSLGGEAPSYYLDYNNFTNTPTIPTAVSDLSNDTGFTTFDSTNAINLIDSAYINARASSYDSGNFTGQLAAASTSDLSEGTNLYYTTARHDSDFDARLSGGTGVTVSSGQVSIGQAVAITDSVTFAGLTVSGNLNVTGTTTTVNSITYTVTDPLLHLADSNETSDLVDIGFIGHYSPDGGSTKEHTGFFRDASNAEYYIFNGLIDAAFDSSLPTNVVDRNGTGFELATLNVGSIVGQYAGFDSDVTAAGLATQTYVDNAVAALPDSAQVATIVTSYGYSTFDSTNALSLIDSAYIQARQVDLQRDSAFVTGIVDSAYIQARQVDLQRDSAFVTGIVDSSYIQARQVDLQRDSAFVTGIIDSAYIQARQVDSQRDSAFVTGIIDSAYIQARQSASSAFDSTNATGLIDSAYIQARQDFAYSSLTGAPTNISTFTNDAGYTTYDSDNFTGQLTNPIISAIIDDSSLTIDGDGSTGGVKIEDGAITIRTNTGNAAYADFYCEVTNAHRTRVKSADHASYSGNVDVTLPTTTGTLALTSDIPTALSSFSNDTNYLDSTTVLGVIDATYIQTNQTTFLDSALTTQLTTALVDSAYVQARQSATGGTDPIFKTISVSGQSDVVADTTTDTLTLVAGSNITITTDAGTDTITFASSGGGLDSALITQLIDSAYVQARQTAGGGGGLDSAATNTLIDAKLQVLDVSDVVGADGNAGQLLKSLGNGEAEWTDFKLSDYTPTTSTSTGTKGELVYDSNYMYMCIATDTWRRIAWTDSSW